MPIIKQPFPISSKNSIPALMNLLTKSFCHHVLCLSPSDSDSASPTQKTLHSLLQNLKIEHNHSINIIPLLGPDELYPRLFTRPITPYTPSKIERLPLISSLPEFKQFFTADGSLSDEWPGIIIHSSGSTSLPKPIVYSQKLLYTWSTWTSYGEVDLSGVIFAGYMLPAFHAIGVCGQIMTPFASECFICHHPVNLLTILFRWNDHCYVAARKRADCYITSAVDGRSAMDEV
jgi:hypothetical protein